MIKSILFDLIHRFEKHRLSYTAAALAYFFALAIFPMFIFLHAILGLFDVELLLILEGLEPLMPTSVFDMLTYYIQSIASQSVGVLSLGFIFTMYASSAAFNSIINGVLVAYNQPNRMSWFKKRLLALLFTLLFGFTFIVFLIIPVVGSYFLPIIGNIFPNLVDLFDLLNRFSWVVSALIILGSLAFFYKVIPERCEKCSIWWGALFSLLGWVITSYGFVLYVTYFANYSVYGIFGSIMVFLIWLYITGIMIILGAEINDAIDQYRKKEVSHSD